MLNILTIDLEDYFQVHAFSKCIRCQDWGNYEGRVEHNTYRLLDILDAAVPPPIGDTPDVFRPTPCVPDSSSASRRGSGVKATFFVLGWIAERYPGLIREIKKQGHEIASHGYDHQVISSMSPGQFRADIHRSKSILEDLISENVLGYRAPTYSIGHKQLWALKILAEEGYRYDSSIFPIRHDIYGIPDAPRFPFTISFNGNGKIELPRHYGSTASRQHGTIATPQHVDSPHFSHSNPQSLIHNPQSIVEFPISTVRFGNINIPISGGGYFRLFPYSLVRKGLTRINQVEGQPFVFYLHPWEIDPDQPRINHLNFKSRFRHYINLGKTEKKLKNILGDFNFSSMRNVLELKNNTAVPQHECFGSIPTPVQNRVL